MSQAKPAAPLERESLLGELFSACPHVEPGGIDLAEGPTIGSTLQDTPAGHIHFARLPGMWERTLTVRQLELAWSSFN